MVCLKHFTAEVKSLQTLIVGRNVNNFRLLMIECNYSLSRVEELENKRLEIFEKQ